jgi:hypothetical protein
VAQLTYRATETFSVTFGVLGFHGGPDSNRIPLHPVQLFDTLTTFD